MSCFADYRQPPSSTSTVDAPPGTTRRVLRSSFKSLFSSAAKAVLREEEAEEKGWRSGDPASDSESEPSDSDWEPPQSSRRSSKKKGLAIATQAVANSLTTRRRRWHPPAATATPPSSPPRSDDLFPSSSLLDKPIPDGSELPEPSQQSALPRRLRLNSDRREAQRRNRSLRRLNDKATEMSKVNVRHKVGNWAVANQRTQAGFAGFKAEPPTPDSKLKLETLSAGSFPYSAADVLDAYSRRIIYRAYGNSGTLGLSDLLWDTSKWLETQIPPLYKPGDPKNVRGPHPAWYFPTHASYVAKPRASAYLSKHLSVAKEFARRIAPAINASVVVFKARFPEMHADFKNDISQLQTHERLQDPPLPCLFGPWASACINGGGRVATNNHKDQKNRVGVCCVIPFGNFDHTESARLVCEDLGIDIEVPPGIPIFLPSALVRHRNTKIVGGDRRGSLVFWSAGDLSRWLQLGGRRVGELGDDEKREWKAGHADRVERLVSLFPIVSQL